MPKKTAPAPWTLTLNATNCAVEIVHDGGKHEVEWPYKPILTRLVVSLDDRGTKYERFCYRAKAHATDNLARWTSREQAGYDIPEAALAAAETAVRKLWADHDAAIASGHSTWQYKLLLAKHVETGWPRLFTDDLTVHDSYTLATVKPEVFLWALREYGTWLHCDNGSVEWRAAEIHQERDAKYFIGQRSGLRAITAEQYAKYEFKEVK
jgi:hypothetical protein